MKRRAQTAVRWSVGGLILCWALLAAPIKARESHPSSADSLSGANLPKDAIQQILKEIEATAYDTPKSWEVELRIEHLQLGDAPALVVKGSDLLCGPTANCQVWVFRRSAGGRGRFLFPPQPLIVDSAMFGPKKTRGVEDLVVTTNWSTSSAKKYTYKFDGAVYRKTNE